MLDGACKTNPPSLPPSYNIIREPGKFVRFKRFRKFFSLTEEDGSMFLPTAIPRDYSNGVFLILVLHSAVIALPWNVFMIAGYKIFKQKVYVSYGFHFIPLIGIAALIPNLLVKIVFLFIVVWKNILVISGKLVTFLIFCFLFSTGIWSTTKCSTFPLNFYIPSDLANRTALLVFSFIITSALASLLEVYFHFLVDIFPFHYTGAQILGKHICAVVISILVSITFAAYSDYLCVLIIFYFSTLTCLFCLIMMCYLGNRPFFQYRKRLALLDEPQYFPPLQMADIVRVWQQNRIYFFKIFWIYFVPNVLFPSIIESVQPNMKIVGDLTCFLLYNFCSALGALTLQPIKMAPNTIRLIMLIHTLFIPYFLFSPLKIKQRDGFTLFSNAWLFSIGLVIFGFISGFLEQWFIKPSLSDAELPLKEVKLGISRILSVLGSICGLLLSVFILQTITGLS